MKQQPPLRKTFGNPPKQYEWTGEWAEQQTGFYKAVRTTSKILAPVYEDQQRNRLLDMEQAIEKSI